MRRPSRRTLLAVTAASLAAALLGVAGVKRYARRLVDGRLVALEKRLAPRLEVSHGDVTVGLLRRSVTVRDVRARAPGRGSLQVGRVTVHRVERKHSRPRFLELSFEGLQGVLPVSTSELARGLAELGYRQVACRGRLAYRWDEKRGSLALEELSLTVRDLGDLRVRARLAGFDPARLAAGGLAPLALETLELDYQDASLLARLAEAVRREEPALGRELAAGIEDVVASFGGGGEGGAAAKRETARAFLAAPWKLRARLRLRGPLALQDLGEEHRLSKVLARFRLELAGRPPRGAPGVPEPRPLESRRVFDPILRYEPQVPTTIRTGDGRVLSHLGEELRFPVDPASLPPFVRRAFLAAEDGAFPEHEGVDPTAVVRALLRNLRRGDVVQGGSTITQQLIKRLLVGPEKSVGRKAKEALLALRLERLVSKSEILRIYLDQIYFGSGAYGVEAAARTYFARPAARLSVAQAALIAGLPRAPSASNPYRAPEAARARQRWVLDRMRDLGWLSPAEHEAALAERLVYRPAEEGVWTAGAWYVEEVRRWLASRFEGTTGLEVRTAMDLAHQAAAEEAIRDGLEEASDRIGVYGPTLEAALVSLDPRTGHVLALVGGRDFQTSQFSRATQARRQAGSAFKPFVYSAALDRGFTAASVLEDEPMTFFDPHTQKAWKPANFADRYHGKVLLRTALVKSLNLASVRLADAIGVEPIRARARALGLGSDIPPYLSISLGSAEVSLLAMCRAYSAFARGGSWIEPQLVIEVKERGGRVIYEAEPHTVEALSPQNACLVNSILKDVIRSGTATVCRRLGRPAAGKTGTSNEARDGWFIGYTPYLVTGVWVGFDDGTPMGDEGVGGRVAAPIWLRYREAVEEDYEPEDFPVSPGVVFRTVSAAEQGATGEGDAVYELPFVTGSGPWR